MIIFAKNFHGKKMKYKAIYFDFDGTIANTAPGIIATMTETFRRLEVPIPSEQDMRATIGLLLIDALKQLGNLSDEMAQKALETYQSLFKEIELKMTKLFPEVPETLKNIHSLGSRFAVVTSRGLESLQLILSNNGLWNLFETCTTRNDKLTPKPAPDMVLTLLKRMNLNAKDVLVIGDTTYDIEMGNSAGCDTCAVTYGNHTIEQLMSAKPKFVINKFSDLINIIK